MVERVENRTYHNSKVGSGNEIGSEERDKLFRLYGAAQLFVVGEQMAPFREFYRCKPDEYWWSCEKAGAMEPCFKGLGGHDYSAISNGRLRGLFFSGRPQSHGGQCTLPPVSPFGPTRLRLPARCLLDPTKHSVFFADFYCNGPNNAPHYITVAIARKGTKSDTYCRRTMPLLSVDNSDISADRLYNPFMTVDRENDYRIIARSAKNIWVVVFYTECVPLSWGRFDTVATIGWGQSCGYMDVPHHKHCAHCNVEAAAMGSKRRGRSAGDGGGKAAAKRRRCASRNDEKQPQRRPASSPQTAYISPRGMSAYMCTDLVWCGEGVLQRRGGTAAAGEHSRRTAQQQQWPCCGYDARGRCSPGWAPGGPVGLRVHTNRTQCDDGSPAIRERPARAAAARHSQGVGAGRAAHSHRRQPGHQHSGTALAGPAGAHRRRNVQQ